MTTLKVTFDLDQFRQRVQRASDKGNEADMPPVISQSTAVMALSLADAYERLRANTVDDPTSIYHEHDRLRSVLAELVDAVEAHKGYWPRVDWESERCERAILTALDKAKKALDG